MSIRIKLMGVVTLLGMVALAIGLLAWNRMGVIKYDLDHIVNHSARAESLTLEIRKEIWRMRGLEAHQTTEAEAIASHIHALLDELNAAADRELLTHAESLAATLDRADLAARVTEADAEWIQAVDADLVAAIDIAEEQIAYDKAHADKVTASSVRIMLATAVIAVAAAVTISLLIIGRIVSNLNAVLARVRQLSEGEFSLPPLAISSQDEVGKVVASVNTMQSDLRQLIQGVVSTAEQVAAAATQVAASSEEMAASTDHQRAQLTQVAAAIEELSATVTEVSGRTGEVSRQSNEAGTLAGEGGDIVRRTVSEMNEIASQVESTSVAVGQLSERAVQIGEILTVINDIADQTNLLALNAAIEAARAGEHGRGFAVVADEVRKLAERTQQATQEVSRSIGEIQSSTGEATDLMGASQGRVAGGVELANRAGESLESIVRGSSEVARSIDSIAAAVEQQSASSAEIARAIESISASADEATQGAGQAAAAATQLSTNAETLREMVARFKV